MIKKVNSVSQDKQKLNQFVVFVFVLILVLFGIQRISQKFSPGNNQPTAALQNFKSTRVPLSFNYPVGFPVTRASDESVGSDLDELTVEDINFSETYLPNATDDSYGYLTVKKIDIKDLQMYLKNYYEVQAGMKIAIETTKAADTTGYRVHIIPDPLSGDSLSATTDWIYFFYKNGYLYQTALTNPMYKNSNANDINNVFTNTILPSMKFE